MEKVEADGKRLQMQMQDRYMWYVKMLTKALGSVQTDNISVWPLSDFVKDVNEYKTCWIFKTLNMVSSGPL